MVKSSSCSSAEAGVQALPQTLPRRSTGEGRQPLPNRGAGRSGGGGPTGWDPRVPQHPPAPPAKRGERRPRSPRPRRPPQPLPPPSRPGQPLPGHSDPAQPSLTRVRPGRWSLLPPPSRISLRSGLIHPIQPQVKRDPQPPRYEPPGSPRAGLLPSGQAEAQPGPSAPPPGLPLPSE